MAHPIIDHNYIFSDPVFGGELSWSSNLLSFSRSDVNQTLLEPQDMNRAITEIKWRRRFTDALGITYTPFGALRGDVYQYDNGLDPTFEPVVDNVTNPAALIEDETLARGLATGGVTVAYPWVANGGGASHVVEPIGQIIARQDSVDQRQFPDEDAKSLVFDDTNLFETTKFSGYDRLETGTRANVGVQYTFQAYTGGYARVLAGQSFHLAGDNVYADPGFDPDSTPDDPLALYSPRSGLETDQSDYVLGVYLAPVDFFRILAQSRFDEESLDLAARGRGRPVALRSVAPPVGLRLCRRRSPARHHRGPAGRHRDHGAQAHRPLEPHRVDALRHRRRPSASPTRSASSISTNASC